MMQLAAGDSVSSGCFWGQASLTQRQLAETPKISGLMKSVLGSYSGNNNPIDPLINGEENEEVTNGAPNYLSGDGGHVRLEGAPRIQDYP